MKQIGIAGALALSALLAGTVPAAQARQSQAQPQVQTPQQTQQAQQAREQAESYLRKEESAATGRQNQSTDRANQDAGVADEASGHSDAARPARSTDPNAGASGKPTRPASTQPAPSYGPVLKPRQPQAADPARKDPAEVRDETDTLTREALPQSQSRQPKQQQEKQSKRTQRRREAWQPIGPLAPRPPGAGEAPAIGYGALTIPPPAPAPEPVVPSIAPLNSCIGGACRDASGGTYNLGPTGTGVSSSGRLCSSNGTTVQCF